MGTLRKITLTLEEDVARWARLEAAKQETSVSGLLGDLLKQKMVQQDEYNRAMKRALKRKSLLKCHGERYLSREQVHERSRLR
jgi:hypothetical protein